MEHQGTMLSEANAGREGRVGLEQRWQSCEKQTDFLGYDPCEFVRCP